MATLVLGTVGRLVGGPIGGAIGALVGNTLDNALFGKGRRDGPRLQELRVTTASYGVPIARHHGRVRVPGSIIWSTDLTESSEQSGGGKGAPKSTTYSYTVSFAVALSSRTIVNVGRIWADGSLLRGEAGDLKAGGQLRIYRGHGDQPVDPLLASACGPQCPAFRGLAYCVFEDLQLGEFGNRIPTLTFELLADETDITLASMLPDLGSPVEVDRELPQLQGFSDEGGALAANLEVIDEVYPLSCDASGLALRIRARDLVPSAPISLAAAAIDGTGDSFGATTGESRRRQADLRDVPEGMRYYDVSRDFQVGLQRADGRARPGRSRIIEFPGTLEAQAARNLANQAAERAAWNHERLSWRLAELDPTLGPGEVVRVPGRKGLWRIESWEWRDLGVELDLLRIPHMAGRAQAGDAGVALPQADLPVTPTLLHAFELPWDGQGSASARTVHVAASSAGAGWTGAALFAQTGNAMIPAGTSGRWRSVVGQLALPLPAGDPALVDRTATLEVDLSAADFALVPASIEALAGGANRALAGTEIIQFTDAQRLAGNRWRLSGLLRGRGGTEIAALAGQSAGQPFVLLDERPLRLDPEVAGQATAIAASGIADPDFVIAPVTLPGLATRPLTPVHPRAVLAQDGALQLSWARRARGAWMWPDQVDAPLNEEAELYRVGVGTVETPKLVWETGEPRLFLSGSIMAALQSDHPGKPVWVRQVGRVSASDPLLLHVVPQ